MSGRVWKKHTHDSGSERVKDEDQAWLHCRNKNKMAACLNYHKPHQKIDYKVGERVGLISLTNSYYLNI